MTTSKHQGGCHCGALRYEAEVDLATGSRCNCRICTKVAQTGAIVKPQAFRWLAGEDRATRYPNAIGARFFCPTCGVHVMGNGSLPELGGEFVSVNLNTLDDVDPNQLQVVHWDGRNDGWQKGPRDTPWPVAG